ncbi:hypothetical protein [Streptacidiphilus carbonis]|jgi:hypothetical protein|uniref:hypothetical protein n=1 Tax=Streptacidiphilus carbonis TaxID=105422 RepID=UPI0005AB1665|nr:hypothetical protein [Streptacidiphilus carbonis]
MATTTLAAPARRERHRTTAAVRTSLRLGWAGHLLVPLLLVIDGTPGLAVPFVYGPEALRRSLTAGPGLSRWDAVARVSLHLDQTALFLLTVPTVFAVGAALGQHRALTGRGAAVMFTQSISPVRWFLTRLGLAAGVLAIAVGGMTALQRASVDWTAGHGLLVRSTANTIMLLGLGPASVMLSAVGLAVGSLAGVLARQAWVAALLSGATTFTLAVANRLTLVQQGPLRLRTVDGHTLITGVSGSDYWLQQLLHGTVLSGLAVLAVLAAVRVLRQRFPA